MAKLIRVTILLVLIVAWALYVHATIMPANYDEYLRDQHYARQAKIYNQEFDK